MEAYAVRDGRSKAAGPLFASDQADTRLKAMREAIDAGELLPERRPDGLRRADGGWIALDSVFQLYRRNLGVEDSTLPPNAGDLVEGLPEREVEPEIREKVDAIAAFGAGAAEVGLQ